jgi:hypothetical protein
MANEDKPSSMMQRALSTVGKYGRELAADSSPAMAARGISQKLSKARNGKRNKGRTGGR